MQFLVVSAQKFVTLSEVLLLEEPASARIA